MAVQEQTQIAPYTHTGFCTPFQLITTQFSIQQYITISNTNKSVQLEQKQQQKRQSTERKTKKQHDVTQNGEEEKDPTRLTNKQQYRSG